MKNIIDIIDKYWRGANYLTVANMYLNHNKYLSRQLEESDVKEFASGHWGTCPGINFIYAHMNRYIKEYKRKTQLIIGPGHGGNALLANLQLEDAAVTSSRTEVNPYFPGAIYDGGELGYSLAVAFGSVLDAPDALCVCVIGDGEAETGTISASWSCKEYLDCTSGFVLPVLHLNGYKMGGKSLLSGKSDEAIKSIFSGLGYRPVILGASHAEMFNALNWVECTYKEIEQGKHNEWPVLVFRSPKGWTAPDSGDFLIEGTLLSHKSPLRYLRSEKTRNYLYHWLKSYRPEELFNADGKPDEDILSIIPEKEYRLGNSLHRYQRKRIALPVIDDFCHSKKEGGSKYRNVLILEKYLSGVMKRNARTFRIVSPDELQSNLLDLLKTVPVEGGPGPDGDNGRVMEILNENVCQAWMQGYIQTGRNCLMISYEAFMPIITSMVSQYAKWLFQANQLEWRQKMASATYLLTSLCWANTYSHQNPEFINSMLGHQYAFMRIYMPPDANSLLACTEICLSSEGKINVIISTKQMMPQWLDWETAQAGIKNGAIHWDWLAEKPTENPDVVVAAAGDYPVREGVEAISKLKEYMPDINIRFISVVELTSIGSLSVYPHAMASEDFNRLFGERVPIVFCFHGYPSAIKMLLHDRVDHQRLTILGYDNQSIFSANDLNKMIVNKCSRYHIVLEVSRLLCRDNRMSTEQYERINNEINHQIEGKLCSRHD